MTQRDKRKNRIPGPLQQLIEDHRNFVKLLRFLRDEVGNYDDVMQETQVAQILEALDYISAYPQKFHHPLEEAAFDFMIEQATTDVALIQRIREQHTELEQETAELLRLFNMIYEDHVVPIDRLKDALNRYLDLQFQHIETEDREIFPVFEKELSAEDWQRISLQVEQTQDPLFNAASIGPYSELSRRLGLG